MEEDPIKYLDADELKTYVAGHHEKDYLLVDVRQPEEYSIGHIPGAHFLPLPELETRLFGLPSDRDLIFYCRTGSRSLAASLLASEGEVTEKSVYNVSGGIMAWDGHQIEGFPRVDVLRPDLPMASQMATAMNLEKGAYRFYVRMLDRFTETPVAGTVDTLSKAESAHARLVYDIWRPTQTDAQPFDRLFEGLDGDILEGGDTLSAMLQRFETLDGDPCINFVEIALGIEYAAYDLYRTLAEQATDPSARSAFVTIAQAEKGHMRLLTKALAKCGP